MLNRCAVIVRPAQPFLDWAAQVNPAEALPGPEGEAVVYLLPECNDREEAWEMLEEVYLDIFENELDAWHADSGEWPEERTFEMFAAWFKVDINTVIEDLCDYELENDDGME